MNENTVEAVCELRNADDVTDDDDDDVRDGDDVTDDVTDDGPEESRGISQDGSLLVASRLAWAFFVHMQNPGDKVRALEYFELFRVVWSLFDFETEGDHIQDILFRIRRDSRGAVVEDAAQSIARFIRGKSC